MSRINLSRYLVHYAVSVIFVIFGLWEIIDFTYWSSFIPGFISGVINAQTALLFHGIILMILGVWIFSGYKIKIPAFIGVLIMFSIVIDLLASSGFTPAFVRDFVIMLVTASIIFEDTKKDIL
jgi:hypothetical protein